MSGHAEQVQIMQPGSGSLGEIGVQRWKPRQAILRCGFGTHHRRRSLV
jgi:hypothetical protein